MHSPYCPLTPLSPTPDLVFYLFLNSFIVCISGHITKENNLPLICPSGTPAVCSRYAREFYTSLPLPSFPPEQPWGI